MPRVTVSANVPLIKIADYSLAKARAGAAAVTLGDFIYVVGGNSGDEPALRSIERFDPRTGRSELFANLHTGRAFHGAVGVAGKIYVIGGKVQGFAAASLISGAALEQDAVPNSGLIPDDSVEIVDVATAAVAHGPAMPDARAGFGCVMCDGKIYVIGGEKASDDFRKILTNTVSVFDPSTGQWTTGVPMPPSPRNATAVDIQGLIVRAGGYNGMSETSDVVVFNPRKNTWTELPSLARSMYASSIVFFGHYLFLFGDYDSPASVLAYDLVAKTSEMIDVPFKPARLTTVATHERNIYVIGGLSSSGSSAFDYVQVYTTPQAPIRPR